MNKNRMVAQNNRGSEGKLIDVPRSNWLNVTDSGVVKTQRNKNLSNEKSYRSPIINIKAIIDSHKNSKQINTWFIKRNKMLKA